MTDLQAEYDLSKEAADFIAAVCGPRRAPVRRHELGLGVSGQRLQNIVHGWL